jgi:hypothetical protein
VDENQLLCLFFNELEKAVIEVDVILAIAMVNALPVAVALDFTSKDAGKPQNERDGNNGEYDPTHSKILIHDVAI